MDDVAWTHSFTDGSMHYSGAMSYEMHCNWKIFYENAVDGYHLGYLHDKTLGKLYPDKNLWKPIGRNVVWYSTERGGEPEARSVLSEKNAEQSPQTIIQDTRDSVGSPAISGTGGNVDIKIQVEPPPQEKPVGK